MEKLKTKILHPHRRARQAANEDTKQDSGSPLTGFQHWAVAFIVCNFNVDVGRSEPFLLCEEASGVKSCNPGPEIEIIYPPDVPFSTTDLSAICFNRSASSAFGGTPL